MIDQIYRGYNYTVENSQDLVLTAATNDASWVCLRKGKLNFEVFNFVEVLAGEDFSKSCNQGWEAGPHGTGSTVKF